MKRWARIVILSFAMMLAGGTLAMAAGGMTDIEQKWLTFRKAVAAQQVKDGILTAQQAESQLAELEERLKGEGDSVYERFAKHFSLDGKSKRERGREGTIVRLYAKLTNRDESAVKQACEKDGITVWELARREGHSEHLRQQVLSLASDNLGRKVAQGVMTQEQREEALKKIAESLQSAEPNLA